MSDTRRALIRNFRQILSIASVAYTFTSLHTLQYAMRSHEDDNPVPDNTIDNSTMTQNTPDDASITASSNVPSSGRWSSDEIWLLLAYVEANCVFTAAKGINLKKSEFNKARETVKTKTAGQCHYKWGHVSVFFYQQG